MFKDYYETYWTKRNTSAPYELIDRVPKFAVKYSIYGSIIGAVPNNSLILDVGCGDGRLAHILKNSKNCKAYGTDISQKSLEIAKKNGITVSQCDLNTDNIPFKEKFDAILCIDVIEHLFNPVGAMKEIRNSLKNGGKLIVATPNFARLENRIRMLFGTPRDRLHFDALGDGTEHLQWFTEEKILHFGKLAGFDKHRFVSGGLPFDFLFVKFGLPNLAKTLICEFEK